MLKNIKVGLGITGSFCNFSKVKPEIDLLKEAGVTDILPIVSYSVLQESTRFGKPEEMKISSYDFAKIINRFKSAFLLIFIINGINRLYFLIYCGEYIFNNISSTKLSQSLFWANRIHFSITLFTVSFCLDNVTPNTSFSTNSG